MLQIVGSNRWLRLAPSLAIGGLLLVSTPASADPARYHGHIVTALPDLRLGSTGTCAWLEATVDWEDPDELFHFGRGPRVLHHVETAAVRWKPAYNICDPVFPNIAGKIMPTKTLASYGDIDVLWDWEEGVEKDCSTLPVGGSQNPAIWNDEPATFTGWLLSGPVPECAFLPDPDGSGGGEWTESIIYANWFVTVNGTTFEGQTWRRTGNTPRDDYTFYRDDFIRAGVPPCPLPEHCPHPFRVADYYAEQRDMGIEDPPSLGITRRYSGLASETLYPPDGVPWLCDETYEPDPETCLFVNP